MKKFLLIILLLLISTNSCFALTVKVKIPMNFSSIIKECSSTKEDGGYICKIDAGFGSVEQGIGAIIKYFTFITGLAGVLFIIVNGIMISMAGLEESAKEKSKNAMKMTVYGLLLLLLSGVLLNFIAPWIYQ